MLMFVFFLLPASSPVWSTQRQRPPWASLTTPWIGWTPSVARASSTPTARMLKAVPLRYHLRPRQLRLRFPSGAEGVFPSPSRKDLHPPLSAPPAAAGPPSAACWPGSDTVRHAITVGGHGLWNSPATACSPTSPWCSKNIVPVPRHHRANILFRQARRHRGGMIEAAKKGHCHDFIMALPDGYDTVGEGDGTLRRREAAHLHRPRHPEKRPHHHSGQRPPPPSTENEHLIKAGHLGPRARPSSPSRPPSGHRQNADQIAIGRGWPSPARHPRGHSTAGLYRRFLPPSASRRRAQHITAE